MKQLQESQQQNQQYEKELFGMEQDLVRLQQENETLQRDSTGDHITEGERVAMQIEQDRLQKENKQLRSSFAKAMDDHKSLQGLFEALKQENASQFTLNIIVWVFTHSVNLHAV